MSTALGIAAVTAVLKGLIGNAVALYSLDAVTGPAGVSALPPDRITPSASNAFPSQINIFLYQVTPNTGWSNTGLPSRNARGEPTSRPPLALNLRYLLTAYGARDFDAEILLGVAMQALHETSGLGRDAIRDTLEALATPHDILATAGLRDQVEALKISPLYLDTEEVYRLWSAMQAHYRPSMAYEVTAVLIESTRPARTPAPVERYHVDAITLRQPAIERVLTQAADDAPVLANTPILSGHRLIVEGQQLRGEETRVQFSGLPDLMTPPALPVGNLTSSRIVIPLPDGLRAGVQGIQIVHLVPIGDRRELRRGVESNVAAFVLRPRIVPHDGHDAEISSPEVHDGLKSATVTIRVAPRIVRGQRLALILNEKGAPGNRPARAYTFRDPPWPKAADGTDTLADTDTIAFRVVGVEAGTYLLRVQVDGAENPLTRPAEGEAFSGPEVTL